MKCLSGQQKRAEASPFAAEVVQVVLLEHAYEKALRQILGLVWRVPASSHVGVDRIPIGAAEDRQSFLESLGLESAGLDRLIQAGYHLLGLQTYFTAGEQEVRAWTIHRGDLAPQAAGVIHTDFERGFIRAETAGYDDFVANAGWKGAREKGVVRSEGKEYVVKDGDVMLFRFNV